MGRDVKPPLTTIPPHVVAVEDYRTLAKERLSSMAQAYLHGGSGDEITLKANRQAFEQTAIIPRILRDLGEGNTRLELFGQSLAHPILAAPTAFHHLFHPEGEIATARGISALEGLMVVSTSATETLEDISRHCQNPPWFQLYIQPDKAATVALLRRAEAAGYHAIVVTADAPLHGLRNREQRAGFQLPPHIQPVNHPPAPAASESNDIFSSPLVRQAPTWDDLRWLRQQTSLPLILKGVMHPGDGLMAREAGMDGLIVSNHGGRTLDTVPATLTVLPAIREATGPDYPILIDGGIRRGSDVFKAIALGAQAVLVGRPIVDGLASAGAVGVAHILRILHAELALTMVFAGTPQLQDITPDTLQLS
ncbi:MAG: alpha-hydroxy acid oxidase [Verrucomicrobiota bacterium JB023]|nr:alpha-hydroxy acid oxidase [Verrucomicrobiota bacterium JB023]